LPFPKRLDATAHLHEDWRRRSPATGVWSCFHSNVGVLAGTAGIFTFGFRLQCITRKCSIHCQSRSLAFVLIFLFFLKSLPEHHGIGCRLNFGTWVPRTLYPAMNTTKVTGSVDLDFLLEWATALICMRPAATSRLQSSHPPQDRSNRSKKSDDRPDQRRNARVEERCV